VIIGVDEDHVGPRIRGDGFTTEDTEGTENGVEEFHSEQANSNHL
jgi:hypothetical protein